MGKVSIYEPRTLLAAIRLRQPVQTFLTKYFREMKTFTTETVDVDFYKGRRKMAPFVSPRLPGQTYERSGYETKVYKPALIKPTRPITTDDLRNRSFGENIYATKSPDERAKEMLANDLFDLDESITRREEWMRAQVLFTGRVDMIGDGVDQTLDYEFTNKVALTGAHRWSDPSSNPLDDLTTWRLAIIQKSGTSPDEVILASDVANAFMTHPFILKLFENKGITLGQIDPRTLPNGVTYLGRVTRLGLDLYSYDEWYLDEDTDPNNPVEAPMVPSGTVCMLSTRSRFTMAYGSVTIIKGEDFATFEGDRIPDSWVTKDPAQRWLQVNSRPLPIPYEVDSWYVAKVL
ncbi:MULTISPECIES: major capsid protein [Paenibacillus]|uniref:major capsid protein n=1 Tax=Paenibacillus TaxID=44249 RepID=UPI0022B92976|nr:major capsid protein [Paenibacillus caseinilyticus]MCZ8520133.1 major capsid protein [Paenibacillus caseinilyticus]